LDFGDGSTSVIVALCRRACIGDKLLKVRGIKHSWNAKMPYYDRWSALKPKSGGLLLVAGQYRVNLFLIGCKIVLGTGNIYSGLRQCP